MLSYKFLFDIAIILLSTKLLGLLTRKFHMPQVVGALLAGLFLGPAVLDVLHETSFIEKMSELGVIVLMFTAGLETDIKQLKKTGKASFIIALMGVIIPIIGGITISYIFNRGNLATVEGNVMLQNIFIGIILTATSVSITVETLKELGKLSTEAGNAILGAAIIDDILGIIALTIITSMSDNTVNVLLVLGKISMFFLLSSIIGYLFYRSFDKWVKLYNNDKRRFVIISFVFCLLLSFVAERFFGVADITGAFIAGIIISSTKRKKYILARFETISYMLLSPMFFASIGIKVKLPKMSAILVLFSLILIIVAILTKVIGCALGAKMAKLSNEQALQIGVGMVSRGEVALIVANKGSNLGLLSPLFLPPIIIMVVTTTVITPILLKIVFNRIKI
ncbi:cation:proton antiporter [Clostridium tarantellae]|uniref:Cation:proton antiporter n=1 Tax=Clostridium tarantellae TaxID=39493 RepID=A0A6I1MLH4_9CLOT|nr:cation:proton antiporter [Clostridium tarantellae]MPQ44356.1 cation:proton antiporter [Clostridium tarantellae]